MMIRGTIKTYLADRGFGFINPAGGGGHQFFHCTQWQERHVEPQEGQEVTFEIANNSRTGKLQAVNVRSSLEKKN